MRVWVCVSASVFPCACLWVLHDFVYIQLVRFFFPHAVFEYVPTCPRATRECLMFVNVFSVLRIAFQGNTPAGGRHDRETGRRIHHGGPQPQRRPLMVPSIGQYRGGRRRKQKGVFYFLISKVVVFVCSVKTFMSFSVSPDHLCVYEPCSCPSLPEHKLRFWCNKLTKCS